VKPTRISVLVLIAVATGAAAFLLTRHYYADLPSPARYWPITLLLVALAELYTAYTTAARLAGRARPIHPIAVARLAALAKASSPVGAVMAGGYAGFLVHVSRIDGSQAGIDTVTAALGTGFGIALTVCALVLERVCRVKTPPDSAPDD
jgi:hypothetical protein